MRYGYFDDENREYVITTPRTPLPWINYLGSEDFFSLVSNTAGGYSFYRDAKLLRLTRYRYNSAPADGEGHRFYIRDGACVWNPGWQPVRTELDSYCLLYTSNKIQRAPRCWAAIAVRGCRPCPFW